MGGTQYVAVPTGWGGWVKGFAPQTLGHERGSTLFVFSIPDVRPSGNHSVTAEPSR
ncbi:MAG: hypothetical protein M3N39_01975 [Pseudomonadota bacterium]|nr:hypothetical protein [Pseudomonadota bacterium]